MQWDRGVWSVGSIIGLLAVALLAVGSHAVTDAGAAARVQLVGILLLAHAPVVLLLAVLHQRRVACVFVLGLLIFAAGVLGRALFGIEWPLPVAPIGGLLLMGAWLWLAVIGCARPASQRE